MKKDIKELLIEKELREYLKSDEFKDFMKDVNELVSKIGMFKLKYGIDLNITYNQHDKNNE